MAYSISVITDPAGFEAAKGVDEAAFKASYFTEHYSTYTAFLRAYLFFYDRYPKAELRADTRIPPNLIDEY